MQVVSKLVKIKNNGKPTTEYVENELKRNGINPLRWAIVEVDDDVYTISVADLKE